ncbi:DNA-directed RNA polymerase subunit omega [Mariniblastus fucicola]|uniref:DNA-directed RNA polymerase subunit omega n=1 Tax=Mariniblastus fucicola TaxID=980251 RepID=A0A5B9PPQ0_9BACT|nr:DNA-directed RNA polymerase subunit omega [Mariniblastus fucicola]QEG24461.1 DNA-directed RNA polymerase subunit omega [Mariniblastus fucicola]
MYDALKEEEIVRKVGGRFKLSTLIQKRLVQLNQGSRPLVEDNGGDKMSLVLEEILQDKIYLDENSNIGTGSSPDFESAPELDLDAM